MRRSEPGEGDESFGRRAALHDDLSADAVDASSSRIARLPLATDYFPAMTVNSLATRNPAFRFAPCGLRLLWRFGPADT